MSRRRIATSVAEVVRSGLCIGCGLCEAVSGGRVRMAMTAAGALRPWPLDGFDGREEDVVLQACPGVVAIARVRPGVPIDPIWGSHSPVRYGWAADPSLRFEASSGGVLTALGVHLLRSGMVGFVLHVGADETDGLITRTRISETPEQVIANKGSRYGPAAPLTKLGDALDRNEPFALIAKPCDAAAVHALGRVAPKVDELCTHRLVMVCGGQSNLTKSLGLLEEAAVDPDDVALFRYRGFGNPGPTRVETRSGEAHERSYLDMWEDEGTWDLASRCTLCPDALGETADVAAADVWPGAHPEGDDEGFNAVIPYTDRGRALVESAVEAGELVLGDPIEPRQLDAMQPHQLRKKHALATRYRALADAGRPVIDTIGLRIDQLGARLDDETRTQEYEGTRVRIEQGRYTEGDPMPATGTERWHDPLPPAGNG